ELGVLRVQRLFEHRRAPPLLLRAPALRLRARLRRGDALLLGREDAGLRWLHHPEVNAERDHEHDRAAEEGRAEKRQRPPPGALRPQALKLELVAALELTFLRPRLHVYREPRLLDDGLLHRLAPRDLVELGALRSKGR